MFGMMIYWHVEGEQNLSNYDEYLDHKADHERLLDDVRDLMDDYEDGVYVDVEGFGKRLDAWFSEHFRTRDARLHKKIS